MEIICGLYNYYSVEIFICIYIFKTPIFHSYKALGQVWQILMKEITACLLFSEIGISNSNTETVNSSSSHNYVQKV